MGGVLQRLAQRALGAQPRVRPRLAGRYEGGSEPIESHVEAIVPPRAMLSASPDQQTQPSAPRASEATPTERLVPPARALDETVPLDATPPARRQVNRKSGKVPQVSIPALVASSNPAMREIGSRDVATVEIDAEPQTPVNRDLPFPARPKPADEPFPDSSTRAQEGLLLPELREVPGESARTPALPAFPPPDREPPPDVHISIGRIEVRADRPEPRRPPPPPTRPRPKLMSLEEYLARGRAG